MELKILRTILSFIFLPILSVGYLLSQELDVKFHRISHEHGLSQASVNCIVQDRRGFLWFGTQDGLNRYDGYNFKVSHAIPASESGLPDDHIRSLCVDNTNDYIWIGAYTGGLCRFDWKTGEFCRFSPNPGGVPGGVGQGSIFAMFQDREGILWLGTWGGGLYRFEPDTGSFSHFVHITDDPLSLNHDTVRAIYEDHANVLWIGTYGGGLSRLNRATGTFSHFKLGAEEGENLGQNQVMVIRETSDHRLWVGTDGGGIFIIDAKRNESRRYVHVPGSSNCLGHNRIRDIYQDTSGIVWIATYGGGVSKYDSVMDSFKTYRREPMDPLSLSDNQVLSIFEDNSGILWFGTFSGGVNKLDRQSWKFRNYSYIPNNPDSISSRKVRAFAVDRRGTLWVGTNGGGLNRYDRQNDRFTKYRHQPDNQNSLSHDRIYALHYDGNVSDTLWIGTFDGGLDRLDIRTDSFTHYQHEPGNPNSISNNRLRTICPDFDGSLWLGIWRGGVDRFDYRKNTFTHYSRDPEHPQSLSYNSTYCIYRDSKNVIWIGTLGGGLNRFNRDQNNFTHFRHEPENANSISSDGVMCVLEASDGLLWVGTSNGGLNRFDKETGSWRHYTSRQGLTSNTIYGILEDKDGDLWLSTTNGLFRFQPDSGEFVRYDTFDGLQDNEFSGGAYHLSTNGEMFFGGISGFNSFYPEQVKKMYNSFIPPVYITQFKKFNRPVDLPNPLDQRETIHLSHRDNFISFDFVALNFHSSERNNYAYKLEGFNRNWVQCGSSRTASYTNLDGGNYVFKVKASNNDGLWNHQGISIALRITPPFWKTWWFKGLMGIATVMAILLFVSLRTRAVRRRNHALQRINAKLNNEIDERRQVEEALQASEEKYRTLFENSLDVHYRADGDGTLIMISPSGTKLMGYDNVDEMLGRNISTTFYYDPKERDNFLTILKRYGKVINYEVRLKNKLGQPIDVETSSRFVYDSEGNITAVEGILRDISPRKRAEAENYRLHNQLMNAKKMEAVGTLAGGMAHEFNNLMAVIDGNAHMLLDQIPPGWDLVKQVKAIVKASQRCSTLTNQLLSFSKKQMLKLKNVNLNDLVTGLEESIRGVLGPNSQLMVHLEDEPGKIKVDSELMIQVIMGIVENAHDAMPHGGTLTIETRTLNLTEEDVNPESNARIGSYVCLSFIDTGVGMDEETLQHIFEPFFTTKQVGQGTGLDLSFVYGTVSQHNGWLEVDSAPGKGTTMKVYLPVFK